MPGWSAPLDGSGQTLEALAGYWSQPLDGYGQTAQDAGNPLWSPPLDGSGRTLLGFALVSVGPYQVGQPCVLTVAGVNAAYTVDVDGAPVATTDDLDGNGDGTITFTAPRAVAYGQQVSITLTMGENWVAGQAAQTAEAGLAFVNLVAPLADPALRLTAVPDLAAGDQVVANNVQGGVVGDITLNADGSFEAAAAVTAFDVAVYDGDWGAFATQAVVEPIPVLDTAPAVSIVSLTHESATFEYFAVDDADGYEWRLDGGAWTDLGAGVGQVALPPLTPETAYSVEVRAYNINGAGPAGLLQFTTLVDPATPPNTPPEISVTALSYDQATITINVGANLATGHEWRLDAGEWNAIGAASSFNVTGLSAESPYTVSVRGYNGDGAGPGASVQFTTQVAPLFPPTTAPEIELLSALYESATMTFIAGATGADGHEYRVNGGLWTDLADSQADFIVAGLAPGQAHTIEMRGYNADGIGPVFSMPFSTLAYPVAHAGSTRYVLWGAAVELRGERSTGQGLTYAWAQVAGTAVTLTGDDTANPTFTAPGADAVLDFELTVTDANGQIDADTVRIRVVEVLPRAAGAGRRWPGFTHTRFF